MGKTWGLESLSLSNLTIEVCLLGALGPTCEGEGVGVLPTRLLGSSGSQGRALAPR